MARVNIYSRPDDPYDEAKLLGWFDPHNAADNIVESKRWNGNNHVGIMSGLQVGYEELYLTKGGKWVRHYNATNEFNGPEFYEFLTDEQAREWLIRDGDDEIVAKYFGALEEEAGPGRPAIGPQTNIRLYPHQQEKVKRLARDGEAFAETIRRLIDEAPEPA